MMKHQEPATAVAGNTGWLKLPQATHGPVEEAKRGPKLITRCARNSDGDKYRRRAPPQSEREKSEGGEGVK